MAGVGARWRSATLHAQGRRVTTVDAHGRLRARSLNDLIYVEPRSGVRQLAGQSFLAETKDAVFACAPRTISAG